MVAELGLDRLREVALGQPGDPRLEVGVEVRARRVVPADVAALVPRPGVVTGCGRDRVPVGVRGGKLLANLLRLLQRRRPLLVGGIGLAVCAGDGLDEDVPDALLRDRDPLLAGDEDLRHAALRPGVLHDLGREVVRETVVEQLVANVAAVRSVRDAAGVEHLLEELVRARLDALDELDDRVALRGLHRTDDLAGLRAIRRREELAVDLAVGFDQPEVALEVRGRVLAHVSGHGAEVLAAVDPVERRLGFLLGRRELLVGRLAGGSGARA